jgi:hypothetical protein
MRALEVTVTHPPGPFIHVRMNGAIDENTDLIGIFKRIEGDAVFHLRGIGRINSPGILQWTNCLRTFGTKYRAVIEEVSYPMAIQATCVLDLFVGAEVRSCMAPYFCPRCKTTIDVLVRGADLVGAAKTAPTSRCPHCTGEMDFDELDSYFVFLKT